MATVRCGILRGLKNLGSSIGSKAEQLLDKKKQDVEKVAVEKKQAASALLEDQAKKTGDLLWSAKSDLEKAVIGGVVGGVQDAKKEAIDNLDAELAKAEKTVDGTIKTASDTVDSKLKEANSLIDQTRGTVEKTVADTRDTVEKAVADTAKKAEEAVDGTIKQASETVDTKLKEANEFLDEKRTQAAQVVKDTTTKAQETKDAAASNLLGKATGLLKK